MTANKTLSHSRVGTWVFSSILGLIALVLCGGGLKLLMLGGSPYYLVAGVMIMVTAVMVAIKQKYAVTLYAIFLLGTAAWAIWESGFQPWPLVARVFAPAILGCAFLFGGSARGKQGRIPQLSSFVPPLIAFALAIFVVIPNQVAVTGVLPPATHAAVVSNDWVRYGNDDGGTHYSPLSDITEENVGRLTLAWRHAYPTPVGSTPGSLETTPIKIGNSLYVCSSVNVIEAIDPDSGAVRWSFDPKVDFKEEAGRHCRGVAYAKTPSSAVCPERVVEGTLDAKLWAVNAVTGKPCEDFGLHGMIDLTVGMGKVLPRYYYLNSAPTIVKGKIVAGGWVLDNQSVDEPSGVVRAFDAATGKLIWAWDMGHPDRHSEPPPGDTYTRGTPNAWAPMSTDLDLGLIYVPTGNATPDFYGAQRTAAMDKYSSSIVALDAETGVPRWSFQTVHHDVWDYDVPAQPTLITYNTPSGPVPALIQATKTGQLYLLDRRNGQPLAPVEERPVPQTHAPGDRVSPTQPFSVGMPSLEGPNMSEKLMWGITPIDQMLCRIQFKSLRYEGPYNPPSTDNVLNSPGKYGAVGWGGISVDPTRGMIVVNSNHAPITTQLIPRARADAMGIEPAGTGHSRVRNYGAQSGTPYAENNPFFLSSLGIPCQQPPFSVLTAIDANTRRKLWEIPLGTMVDSGPLGLRSHLPITMGVPSAGGSLVTAGGLIFIGATQEAAFRAISLATGHELWKARLPAGGHASPMSYRSDTSGRQYVLITAAGRADFNNGASTAYLMAYALPKKNN